nr:MAG TPA: hypothetical protein [Crassvirales sp.]
MMIIYCFFLCSTKYVETCRLMYKKKSNLTSRSSYSSQC